MKPPEDARLRYYVCRPHLEEDALQFLTTSPVAVCVVAVQGLPGMGKTFFLKRLYNEAMSSGFTSIWVDLTNFNPRLLTDDESEVPLARTFEYYRRLLIAIADGLPEHRAVEYRSRATTVTVEVKASLGNFKGGSIEVGAWGKVTAGGDIVTGAKIEVDIDPQLYIGPARQQLTEELARQLSEGAGLKPVVLVADNFSDLLGLDLADWIVEEMVPQFQSPAVVFLGFDRIHEEMEMEWEGLRRFDAEEVHTYLQTRLGQDHVPLEVSATLHRLSGGHPGALAIAAGALEGNGPSTEKTRQWAAATVEDGDWAELVERIVSGLSEPDLECAVKAASSVRRFTPELLGKLMNVVDDGVPERDDLMRRLERYSLVEPDQLPGYYRLLEFIRARTAYELRLGGPERFEDLNRVAAEFYAEELAAKTDDAGTSPYLRWYVNEDTNWQGLAREWLYHLNQLGNRQAARLGLARLYFNAFWWWGAYLPFPFCEGILQEWAQTPHDDDADRDFITNLQHFETTYPRRGRTAPASEWDSLYENLLSIREMAGVDGRAGDLDQEDTRRVRALLDEFLAETRAHFNDDAKVEAYYSEALSLFETLRDDWNRGWTLFNQASLALRRGRFDEADGAGQKALAIARKREIEDYELASNCHSLAGDLASVRGSQEEAAGSFARAVYSAYLFEARPHVPDLYTQAFYEDVCDHVTDWILSVATSAKPEEVKKVCDILWNFWLPYWRLEKNATTRDWTGLLQGGSGAALRSALFPKGPEDGSCTWRLNILSMSLALAKR